MSDKIKYNLIAYSVVLALFAVAFGLTLPHSECPRGPTQDSTAIFRQLYLECNGTIKRWNQDTVSYFKNDIR